MEDVIAAYDQAKTPLDRWPNALVFVQIAKAAGWSVESRSQDSLVLRRRDRTGAVWLDLSELGNELMLAVTPFEGQSRRFHLGVSAAEIVHFIRQRRAR